MGVTPKKILHVVYFQVGDPNHFPQKIGWWSLGNQNTPKSIYKMGPCQVSMELQPRYLNDIPINGSGYEPIGVLIPFVTGIGAHFVLNPQPSYLITFPGHRNPRVLVLKHNRKFHFHQGSSVCCPNLDVSFATRKQGVVGDLHFFG